MSNQILIDEIYKALDDARGMVSRLGDNPEWGGDFDTCVAEALLASDWLRKVQAEAWGQGVGHGYEYGRIGAPPPPNPYLGSE